MMESIGIVIRQTHSQELGSELRGTAQYGWPLEAAAHQYDTVTMELTGRIALVVHLLV